MKNKAVDVKTINSPKEVKPSELKDEVAEMSKIFKKTKTLIRVIAIILVSVFTWLEFHDLITSKEVIPMFTDKFSDILFKVILALYYISWVAGTSVDMKDEEYTLLIAPNKGQLTITATTTILVLGFLFAWLCGTNTPQSFALALSTFFIFNVIGWFYLKFFIKEAIDKSIDKYIRTKDPLGLYKIKIIQHFLWGRWQTYRFITGFFLLVVINIFAFSDLSLKIKEAVMSPSSQFFIVLIFFLYVFIFEIWIWYVRVERNFTFKIIKKIKEDEMINNLNK